MVISVFLNPHTRSSLWFSVFLAWLLHPGRPATCEGLGMNEFYAPFLFPAFCHHLYHLHCCHSHPGHRHRLSELKESPGPCLYSHLARLQCRGLLLSPQVWKFPRITHKNQKNAILTLQFYDKGYESGLAKWRDTYGEVSVPNVKLLCKFQRHRCSYLGTKDNDQAYSL